MHPGQLLSVRGLLADAAVSHALQCRIAQQTTPRGCKQCPLYSTQVLCPSSLGMLAWICSTSSEERLQNQASFEREEQAPVKHLFHSLYSEILLGDYVGIRLREKEFDPRGQRPPTFLDDMVHYNLALSVALLWLSDLDAPIALTREKMSFAARNKYTYPNRTEREAMILSSYAGILMNSIPVEEIFEIYSMRPSATHWQRSANDHWIPPFRFSLHPFAMLTAPEAAEYAWKQMQQK
ncbi:uncharacterized protein C2orf80 homolog isoform X3 [Chiroxiphia lanceolata]|uniref:uncharacterized protein C2orf80 homolog isoform X3 n=1 Tax=Chiroxiphia lanceolata TaxID=296741 RepID=UPI0013CF008F|nr:uncharacterized protein C2orf80 homolog isoform X3 [Chiroxiphia lanceolata]